MRALAAALLLTVSACGTGAGTPLPTSGEGIFCTADVRQCPDGSFVSRNPANGCAFDSCPGAGKP